MKAGRIEHWGKSKANCRHLTIYFYEMLVGKAIHNFNSQITGQKNIPFCKQISNLLRFFSQLSLNRVYKDKVKQKVTKSLYKKDCMNTLSTSPETTLNTVDVKQPYKVY